VTQQGVEIFWPALNWIHLLNSEEAPAFMTSFNFSKRKSQGQMGEFRHAGLKALLSPDSLALVWLSNPQEGAA